jgi:hypothetical protein
MSGEDDLKVIEITVWKKFEKPKVYLTPENASTTNHATNAQPNL